MAKLISALCRRCGKNRVLTEFTQPVVCDRCVRAEQAMVRVIAGIRALDTIRRQDAAETGMERFSVRRDGDGWRVE